MNSLRRLIANHFHDPRMRVPQRMYPEPTDQVEIFLSTRIVDVHSFPSLDQQRIASIGLQQTFLLDGLDLLKGGHRSDSTGADYDGIAGWEAFSTSRTFAARWLGEKGFCKKAVPGVSIPRSAMMLSV